MKCVHYEVLDVGAGQEYSGANYPCSGVFWNPRTQITYVVGETQGPVALLVGRVASHVLVPEPELVTAELVSTPAPTGISEDFVLRLVAITQNPALAPTLLPTRAA